MYKVSYFHLYLFLLLTKSSAWAQGNCGNNDYAGKNDVKDEDKDKTAGTGNTFLMEANDGEFTFQCCGYVEKWEFYAKDKTGDIYFQVWRDTSATSSTWTLVEENQYTHTTTAKDRYTHTPATADRIMVQNGDIIGMHFPGDTVITYDNGGEYKLTTAYGTSAGTFNWGSVSSGSNRDYGIKAHLLPSAAPTIDNLDTTVSIADTTIAGTLLITLTVSDNDVLDTTLITTETSNTASTLFQFNTGSLQVTTMAALTSGTYSVGFQVADTCGLTDTGTLTITVTNTIPTIDNLPSTYSLREDHTTEMLLYTVNTTDPIDAVTCSITSTSPATAPFTMKSDKGIYVDASPGLDYDTTPQYILTIQCTDTKDQVTDTFTVSIIPNEPPSINNLPASYSLSEDHVNELLLYTLNVTDPTNDYLTCSITSPASTPFFIKPVSGTTDYGIFVQYSPNLNYNLVTQYDLTVTCTDNNTPVTGVYTVIVLKNNPPVFTNLDNTTSTSTLATGIGHHIFQVVSTDVENDQLYYNMTVNPSTCPFTIMSSGDILSTGNLLGTTVNTCDLNIYVYDGRTLVGPKTLTITITDINTEPAFTNLPIAVPIYLPENSALGLSLYDVSFTDVNAGDSHTFTSSYTPSSGAKYFSLDTTTGRVTATASNTINYESLSDTSFSITVYVTDGFSFISETLNITVTDVNERPEFHKSYYAVSSDEDLTTTQVVNPGFTVTDLDNGDTNTYAMDCGLYQAYLTMDSTSGNVTFGAGYDLDTGVNPSTFNCNVTVSDGEFTDNAVLQVTINDVNDNVPLFSRPTYSFYVSADDGIGTSFGNISATDADAGTYGVLTFSLNQTYISCNCFAITNTGILYVIESLSPFTNGSTLNLVAIATDGGNLEATATITIVIPVVTTATTTTTTDRYLTFTEDPRNSVWLVLIGFALFGWLILMAYFCHSFGWLDNILTKFADFSRGMCKRQYRRRLPKLRNYKPKTIEVKSSPAPVRHPSSNEQAWEPWQHKDFMTSTF